MDFFTSVERTSAAPPEPKQQDFFTAVENPGPGVAQIALDRGMPYEEAAPIIAASGMDPSVVEGPYRLTGERRQAAADPKTDLNSRVSRAIDQIPIANTVQQVRFDKKYKEALAAYQNGDKSPATLSTIARYEEQGFRQKSAGTLRTIGEAGLKVPGMIAEFGGVNKLLKPVGLAATEANTATQFGARSVATGVLAPSMTAQTASQRSVESTKADIEAASAKPGNSPVQASSWYELRNLAPAVAVSSLNAAVLGSMQKLSGLNAVPTLLGRSTAKGAVGLGEQAGVDTIGAAADTVLSKNWQTRLKTGGTVGDVLRGEDGSTKNALAQAVTFTLFAGAHDPAVMSRLTGGRRPAPTPAAGTPLAATVEFINKGGDPAEAASVSKKWMDLVQDPASAPDAMQHMKDWLAEQKASKPAEELSRKLGDAIQPAIERYTAASQKVSPEDYAAQPEAPLPGVDRDTAWRDMGYDPIETWQAKDVRDFAKSVGIRNAAAMSTDTLRSKIMDEFTQEQNRLATARPGEVPRNPWDMHQPFYDPKKFLNKPKFVLPEEVATDAPVNPTGKPRKAVPVPAERPDLFTRPEGPEMAPGAPPAADQPVPGQEPVQTPQTPPGASQGAAPPSMMDRLRARQAQRAPAQSPGQVEPPLRQPGNSPVPRVPERRLAPAEQRAPIDVVKDRLKASGLSDKQVHILVERERGRSQEDIGSDALFRRGRGPRKGEGQSRANISRLEKIARGKVDEADLAELKRLMGGRGDFTPKYEEEPMSARGRSAQDRLEARREKEQTRAAQIFERLDAATQKEIRANEDRYLNPDGTFKPGVMDAMAKRIPQGRRGQASPETMFTRRVTKLRAAVENARRNPGPEAVARMDAEAMLLRAHLEQGGDKQPGRTISNHVPSFEPVRKIASSLKELKQRTGESDFAYENRKRRSAGARTLYDDVLSDVKRAGKIRMSSMGRGEVEQIIENNPAMKNIFSTDPEQRGGLHFDEYIPSKLREIGVRVDNEFDPVTQFVDLINRHHLAEPGEWDAMQQHKNELAQSLPTAGKKVKQPDFDFGDAAEKFLAEQQAENAIDRTGMITAVPSQFGQGPQQPSKWEAFKAKAGAVWDSIRDEYSKLSGRIAPSTTRLSPASGEALARTIGADSYAKLLAPELIDRVLGGDTRDSTAMRYGAALTEMRLRAVREAYLRQGDVDAASEVKSILGLRKPGADPLGPDTPIFTEAEFQDVLKEPEFQSMLQRYKEHVVPVMEDNFRKAEGLQDGDPIESQTQIPGLPVNLKAWRSGDEVTAGVKKTSGGGGEGNLKNPRQRRLGFAKQAFGNAEGYDVDLRAIIENSIMRSTRLAAQNSMYRQFREDGLAEWGKSGTDHTIRGEPARELPGVQRAGKFDLSLFLDKKIYDEVRQALKVDEPTRLPGVKAFNNVLTRLALASTAEFVYHTKNLLTFAMKPGVHPFDMVKNAWNVIWKDPKAASGIIELARIGAMKDKGLDVGSGGISGLIDPSLAKYDPTAYLSHFLGKTLDVLDQTMRLTASDAFDRLDRRGWIKGGETARRDFVNQLGQYQKAGQSKWVKLLRDTGFGPFATAGSNYWMQGVKSVFLSPGVKASSYASAALLRAEMGAKIMATVSAAALVNYLLWGRADGDDDTPFGAIKVSKSPTKVQYFDLTALTGLTRGLRSIGVMSLIEGLRHGESAGTIVDKAVGEGAHSALHPALGPPVSFAYTALTGKNTLGMQVAEKKSEAKTDAGVRRADARGVPGKDTSQAWLNFQAALFNANPTVASLMGADRAPSHGKEEERSLGSRLWKLLGPYGVKERKSH